ncbi:MAG TPA: recombinase family protein [Pirellulales bacterium]|jgi:DNA invertase Pin-like site-specific DNA recombinase|nr:recombinase family protein [Pirellulales bacterium]
MVRFNCSQQPPLIPRNGHTLEVLIPCRVSSPGAGKQDIRSNDDQQAELEKWLKGNIDLPFKITVLAGSGSGECLERAEYLQLMDLVESDHFDLVISEDLGRIVRRIHAHLFCELCIDHNTRLIALNDHVDTAEDGWQDRSIFSAWHHERSNRDTSDRIKRTHRNRFLQGGTLPVQIYGYRKKPGAKSDVDLEKLPEAEKIYAEWFNRLDRGAYYTEIADWLNKLVVPLGPYCRANKWTGSIVSRITHNWILKGVRFRNKKRSKRHNASGKYKSEAADPSELLIRPVPHLAFFEPAYYDRVVAKADERNAKFRRNGHGSVDPCRNHAKKRVRFPGQCINCGICGRQYVFGANGQKDRLMCMGAREHKCWNGISLHGPLATEKVSAAVFSQIESLADFEPEFLAMVNGEAQRFDSAQTDQLWEISRKIDSAGREIDNLMKFIRGGDDSTRVRDELKALEVQQTKCLHERQLLADTPQNRLILPPVAEIKELAREAFRDLTTNSYDFARRLRTVTAQIQLNRGRQYANCASRSYVHYLLT